MKLENNTKKKDLFCLLQTVALFGDFLSREQKKLQMLSRVHLENCKVNGISTPKSLVVISREDDR